MRGRPGWRRKVDQCLPLDLRQLKAHGRLQAGAEFSWEWVRDGEPFATIHIAVDPLGLTLSYRSAQLDVVHRVELAWTACPFGGQRAWLVCSDCRRRCAILYGVNSAGRFSCRRCLDLTYACEAESVVERLARRQLKLAAKCAPDGGRPRWMRQRTYERICAEIDAVTVARIANALQFPA